MIAVDQSQVEAEINKFINFISPINRSNEKRLQVVAFIRDILHKSALLEGYVIECGSSSLKSYLPESDLDLVLLAPCGKNSREEMQCLTAIFNSWCDEIADKEEGKSTHYDMTIRNVEFVNARTKLAHCLVNNISVDITVNQIGSLLTLTFLEEADRLVGMDHLFKNSLLLIKNWCHHESSYYCGSPIIGAKNGMLPSYAISVMVLHIFNKYTNLAHPFSVLRCFLYTYMSFPWDTHVLTIDGTQSISSLSSAGHYSSAGTPRDPSDLHSVSSLNSAGSAHSRRGSFAHNHSPGAPGPSGEASNRFQSILDALAQHPALALYQQASHAVHHGRFTPKCCNIQDPIDNCNNLGISVPRGSLMMISKACQAGFTHLETILRRFPNSLTINNTNNMNDEYVFSAQQQAQYDANNYKYNPKVKQMLKPVAPSNLGYLGTAPNNMQSDNEYSPYVDSNSTNTTNATSTSSGAHTSLVSSMSAPSIAPYRRNSRSIPTYVKPPFLAEFFPTSLALYCSAEGEPLRCDLLSHPLQPLSTSSLLANPNYSQNSGFSNGSVGSGSYNRPRIVSTSNVFGDNADCVSVTSQGSATTDLVSNTAPESHLSRSNMSVQSAQSTHSVHSTQSVRSTGPTVDPLLGDLRAMYEALDLYVSSRQHPNVTKIPVSTSAKKTPTHSAQSSVSDSMVSAKSLPPLSLPLPLPAAALSVLEMARYASPGGGSGRSTERAGTPSAGASGNKFTPGISPKLSAKYSPAFLPLSKKLEKSGSQGGLVGLGHAHEHSSPTGSTTSGTTSDSPRQRASISISSDSESGDEGDCCGRGERDDASHCPTESESEEDTHIRDCRDRNVSVSRKLDLSAACSSDKNELALTPQSKEDPAKAYYGPVGSIVAFFRTQKVVVTQFCSELPAQLSRNLAALNLTAATTPVTMVSDGSNGETIAGMTQVTSGPGGVRNRKRTTSGNVTAGKNVPPSSSSSAAVGRNNKSAVLAAAATRRSKRAVGGSKLSEVIMAWLQERAELCVAKGRRLLPKSLMEWGQLVLAVVWCIMMVGTINFMMTPGLLAHYTQSWTRTISLGVSYLNKVSTAPGFFRTPTPSRSVQDYLPYEDGGFGQYDFFGSAEMAPSGGFGAAGHSSYAHMFPSAARAAHLMFSAAAAGESVQLASAGHGGPLNVATHWVKEGDAISFGDFGSFAPKPTSSISEVVGLPGVSDKSNGINTGVDATAKKETTPQSKPSTAPSTVPTSSPARATASTASSNTVSTSTTGASSSSKARSPSEYVQKTQYVPKSEYVLATSAVVGSPYQYQWTKDGVNISNTFYQSQPYFSIKKARMEDAGHYRCLRYDAGVPHKPPVLVMETVLQISKPPTVNLRPSHYEIKAGTTMFLNLAAEGTPPPLFQWYRNGYLVPGLTGMALLMEDVNSSHSGTYSCDVQNIAGRFLWLEASVLVVD